MDKTKKRNLIIAIVVVVFIIAGIYIYNYTKDVKVDEAPPTPPVPGGGGNTTPARNDNYPLQEGSLGTKVKDLQWALNRLTSNPLLKLKEDGDFGSKTKNAIYLSVGTTIDGMPTYPVSMKAWTAILHRANNARLITADNFNI